MKLRYKIKREELKTAVLPNWYERALNRDDYRYIFILYANEPPYSAIMRVVSNSPVPPHDIRAKQAELNTRYALG